MSTIRSFILPSHLLFFVNLSVATLSIGLTAASAQETVLRIDPNPDGWSVFDGDQKVLSYITDSNGRPVIYPLIGPAGHAMTRAFPLEDAGPNERRDHDHHRSLWLTHGDVNGVDFWLDDEGSGRIVHRDAQSELRGDAAVIVTHNDWLAPDGERILSDTRRFTIGSDGDRRLIDCDFVLKATDGDVVFGDTKEGSFGMRVAGTMKVDEKMGGRITNAEGLTDRQTWGKESAWVDYSGPVNEQPVGVTIHEHPSSFGFPCRWHVRTYGLFAANPFGVHHFVGGDPTSGVVLKDGDEMRLSYRIVLHAGGLDQAQTESDAKQYADIPRPTLD